MFKINPALKYYQWGSKTKLQSFFSGIANLDIKKDTPLAEAWFGANESGSSTVALGDCCKECRDLLDAKGSDKKEILLLDLLKKRPEKFFVGRKNLPFLLKILSAKMPLSIQVHPSKDVAQKVYEKELNMNLPAEDMKFMDSRQKDEFLIPLSDFYIAHSINTRKDIKKVFEYIDSPLTNSLHKKLVEVEEQINAESKGLSVIDGIAPENFLVKKLFDYCVNLRENLSISQSEYEDQFVQTLEVVEKQIAALDEDFQARMEANANTSDNSEFIFSNNETNSVELILKIFLYGARKFEFDSSLFQLFFMKPQRLVAEHIYYIPAGCMHTYIKGTGVEVITNSDNVARSGLTSKVKDLDLFFEIAKLDLGVIDCSLDAKSNPKTEDGVFSEGFGIEDNLRFLFFKSMDGQGKKTIPAGKIRELFCIDGSIEIETRVSNNDDCAKDSCCCSQSNASNLILLKKGEAVLVPYCEELTLSFSEGAKAILSSEF